MSAAHWLTLLFCVSVATEAYAVTVAPSVTEAGGGSFTQPLALNTKYGFSIDLYAEPTPDQFVGSTRSPTMYCNGVNQMQYGYCTFEIGSTIVKDNLTSVSQNILDSNSYNNGTLSFQIEESSPGTSVIEFTEDFVENRHSERFFIPENDPEVGDIMAGENITTPSSMVEGPVSCDVVGSRATDNDTLFSTTATCSLDLTFAKPMISPTAPSGAPEPAAWAMMMGGSCIVGLFLRRKYKPLVG